MVVTQDFKKQSDELESNDFAESYKIMMATEGFVFFNSGPSAGAS